MDIDNFKRLVTDHRRTKDELKTMLSHALNKGEAEFAHIAKDELDIRFPGWASVHSRKGGASLPLLDSVDQIAGLKQQKKPIFG